MTRDALTVFTPGQIIDTQRVEGTGLAVTTSGTSGTIYRDASSNPLALTLTPIADCWWEVYVHVGRVSAVAAAYNYWYAQVVLNPVDVDGSSTMVGLCTQYNGVDTDFFRAQRKIYKLAADTTYTATASWSCNAGTFTYQLARNLLWIEGKAWTR